MALHALVEFEGGVVVDGVVGVLPPPPQDQARRRPPEAAARRARRRTGFATRMPDGRTSRGECQTTIVGERTRASADVAERPRTGRHGSRGTQPLGYDRCGGPRDASTTA